jgi:exodeoxyribonuclease V alpha subunit
MDSKNSIEKKIESLSRSRFRGSFHLNNKMKEYTKDKGIEKIKEDAINIINQRLKPKNPKNDGKQTPMRQVHPVFIAQHACGFCCRGCLERIHMIPKNRELTTQEVEYIAKFITIWIENEIKTQKK